MSVTFCDSSKAGHRAVANKETTDSMVPSCIVEVIIQPFLSSFMTYHQITHSSMTDVNTGARRV